MKLKVIFENHKTNDDKHIIKGSVGILCKDYARYGYGEPFRVVGKGVAKCNPSDDYDEKYGRALAISRAYADAYQQVYNKLRNDMNKINNHYDQLLDKLHDCIYFEERSIQRLSSGINIYGSKNVNNTIQVPKKFMNSLFNKK